MLELFETFIHVVECGTLSEAAKKMHTNQPNITLRIQRLEKELGVKLFDREGKKLILNPIGYNMYGQASQLLKTYTNIRGEMDLYKQPNFGHIRIGGGFQHLLSIIPNFLNHFNDSHPEITYDMKVFPTDEIYRLVENYDIDFGFVDTLMPISNAEQVELALQTTLGIIVPRISEYGALEEITKQDMYKMPLISLRKGTKFMEYIEQELENGGISPNDLKIKMEFDHIELIIKMVEIGLGAAIIPITTGSEIIKNKDVKLVEVQNLHMTPKTIYLVYKKNRYFPPSFLEFINQIRSYYFKQ